MMGWERVTDRTIPRHEWTRDRPHLEAPRAKFSRYCSPISMFLQITVHGGTEFSLHKITNCRALNCSYYSLPGVSPSLCGPTRAKASSFVSFLDHTQRRNAVGRTPLDEWSARSRDLLPDNTQYSRETDIRAPGGIRTEQSQPASCCRPTPYTERPPG